LNGESISWSPTAPNRSHIVGSVLFGLGWSTACTCPGPAAALLGQGNLAALGVVGGIIVGSALRGRVQTRATAHAPPQMTTAALGL
jgi:uncharacterized membrane protein YedE/YeeE